ncbi:hypothetical protein GX408_13320 [bacterium]|nr:hypothetical protein [bacterium]
MESHYERQIPIWFFIGGIVLIYGLLILAAGLFHWLSPPPVDARVRLWGLHADIWWGVLLLMLGSFYVIKFWPRKKIAEG